MNIKKLNRYLAQLSESIDLETVKNIFDSAHIDYEAPEDERITEYKIHTLYNDYSYYVLSYASEYIMLANDYQDYLSDIANQFAYVLPDGFDELFDSKKLQDIILNDKDGYYLRQAVNYINSIDTEYDIPKLIKIDEVSVDGINYVLLDEI